LEHLTVTIPPLPTQRAIAHILGTLDDKIELNRRMNATLEAMARALFKSWFVDFDPVRAKAAGRQPAGMDAETAALFPDGFQDSALGEVPRGWMAAPYDDVIEIISGGTPKTSIAEYWGGNIPWFSVVDAPNPSDVYVIDTEKRITPAGLENSSTCVLPAGTTIISARGTVGKLALTGVAMAMNQSCYGLRGKATFGQFLTYFTTQGVVSTLLQRTHGSVFNTITRDTFKTVEVVVPSHVVARTFEQRVKPYMHRILNNLLESRTLAALRDALLPKLLSGEIRVRAKGEMA
jgi:type I restriction enzyme S subunit